MGSYSAPSFALGVLKETSDLTIPDGEILIGPVRCLNYIYVQVAEPAWDGDMGLEVQFTDDTWRLVSNRAGPSAETWVITSDYQVLNNPQQIWKYPFNVRVVQITAPTLGTCPAYLITTPGPANPLF
jgi:hypothetical protein